MRVIARPRLVQFWRSRKTDSAIAERDLTAWYKVARKVQLANYGALKQAFPSADLIGNCVVFDVGNNRFRLIARVIFAKGKIYVLKVMDHAEYDKNRWVDQCGCHEPPPKKALPKGRPPHGERKGVNKR